MLYREQNSRILVARTPAPWRIALMIIALAVHFSLSQGLAAEQAAEADSTTAESSFSDAETETAHDDALAKASEAAEQEDAGEEGSEEKEPNNEDTEEQDTDEKDADDGEKSDDVPATKDDEGEKDEQEKPKEGQPAESKSTESEPTDEKPAQQQSKEEKAEVSKPGASPSDKNATPPVEGEPAVEAEREMEVDPPAKETNGAGGKSALPEKAIPPEKKKCIIGATATLLEKQSSLKFRARVDSGAKSCSLHIEKIKIEGESTKENEAERMLENIGKVIHFEVKNGDNKTHVLTSKIAGYVIIKTSDSKKRRYKVPLTFRWKHMEKEVLVTLNDRGQMDYPLLLGRNFLRGDFLVDVEVDSDD